MEHKMKNKILLLILFFSCGIIITSCMPGITSDFMENTTYINHGDSAKIYWNFYEADGVQIQGHYRIYNPQDSIYVTPDSTTSYKVTAFAPEKNDLTINWNVIVDGSVNNQRLKAIDDIAGIPINEINIIGTDSLSNDMYRLNFLALSPTDNFIVDVQFDKDNFDVKMPARTNAKVKVDSCGIFAQPDGEYNGICFCIDNSDANIYHREILTAIEDASEYFHPNDSFYLTFFNHNWLGNTELKRSPSNGKIDNIFKYAAIPSGFCAINTSVAITINYLQKLNKNVNTIILITSSADNASMLYDENELLEHAKKSGIKIYVIAIGQSTPTYNLSKLADGSGGKLFLADEYDLEILLHYINEITFGRRHHYFVDVNFYRPDNIASIDFNLNIINNSKNKLSDNASVILKKEKLFSDYQVVAGFENNEMIINPSYDNLIERLAQALNDNPNLTIELIGNSIEGNENDCKKIALQRSQLVRKRLMKKGVNQEQIRITNNGSESPIYMFPTDDWQHKYNNRVEIRWLVVENYPYEITSEKFIVPSEEAAMVQIESLEHKGYRAYYQRIITNNRPAYRIIIWGYQTEKEVNTALKEINNKLKLQCYVRQTSVVDK